MRQRDHYGRIHGCVIAGDIDLGLSSCPAETPLDLTFRRSYTPYEPGWEPDAEAVIAQHRASGRSQVCARIRGGHRIRFVDHCEFDIAEDLTQVAWRMAPGGDEGLLRILAAGAVLAFRFMLAGELVLHCSAVSVGSRGLAFVGRSGMGKSTMATLMCASGATLVTDDVGRVLLDGPGASLAVGGRESRLRGSAAQFADLTPGRGVRRTEDGRLAIALPAPPNETVPLTAIVIPAPARDRDEVQLGRLPVRDAVIALSSFPRLAGMVDPGLLGDQFRRTVELVERVPVFVAAIPWDGALGRRTAEELADRLDWPLPDSTVAAARTAGY